jgi:hypothetical protein
MKAHAPSLMQLKTDMLAAYKACTHLASDEYYQSILGLSPEQSFKSETLLVRYATSKLSLPLHVCEIGMGGGQLSIMLAACGFHTRGYEVVAHRLATANEVAQALSSKYPSITECFEPMATVYPDDTVASWADMIVATNTVNSYWSNWCKEHGQAAVLQEQAGSLRKKSAIIDVRVWGILREDPKEQQALISEIERSTGKTGRRIHGSSNHWHFR